ncbi:hypothetical protein DER45DRAFT_11275 [Fusarium avenaceum]|nr:hypothetical protein DER45DRAFT_11275 [Fusarium avenaceum]
MPVMPCDGRWTMDDGRWTMDTLQDPGTSIHNTPRYCVAQWRPSIVTLCLSIQYVLIGTYPTSLKSAVRYMQRWHPAPSSEQSYSHFIYGVSTRRALRLFLVLYLEGFDVFCFPDSFNLTTGIRWVATGTYRVDLKLNGSGGPQKRAELEAKHFIPQQIKKLEMCMYHTQNGRVLSNGNTRGGARMQGGGRTASRIPPTKLNQQHPA